MLRDPSGRFAWGGGITGAGAFSAFWVGAGAEGGFYAVGDTLGNQGILVCRSGGIGASSGVGGSASLQGTSVVCPNCRSICDMEGTFGGMQGFAGTGPLGAAGGTGVSLSATSATVFTSGGVGVGGGYGLLG
jgi:hypothetical protein